MRYKKPAFMISYIVIAYYLVSTLGNIDPVAGVSEYYNIAGADISPNQVTNVLFDFRGYDTLGEAIILVTGVLAVSLLFGRGQIGGDKHVKPHYYEDTTLILKTYTPVFTALIICLGVIVTLGGHITPGGGFQGGSIIAAGILLTLVTVGAKALNLSEELLVKLESTGALLYLSLGFLGLVLTGSFLYNTGYDMYGVVPEAVKTVLNYPDAVGAGIIPYLNLAVLVKVSAGLTTVILLISGGGKGE